MHSGIAVIVVNYNTADLLRACLEHVLASSLDRPLQVYVVDNGSSDGSVAMLQEEFANGRLIRPFQAPVVRPNMGHYLVRPAAQRYSRKVEVFTDWMLSTIAAGRPAVPAQATPR